MPCKGRSSLRVGGLRSASPETTVTLNRTQSFQSLKMADRARNKPAARTASDGVKPPPRPTLRFRMHAWRRFQRTLDPLAAPKPLHIVRRSKK